MRNKKFFSQSLKVNSIFTNSGSVLDELWELREELIWLRLAAAGQRHTRNPKHYVDKNLNI